MTSTARQALRRAVLEADPRLVEALFLCEVATSSEGLSAVYAVLGRRRARILREEMREGSDLFTGEGQGWGGYDSGARCGAAGRAQLRVRLAAGHAVVMVWGVGELSG